MPDRSGVPLGARFSLVTNRLGYCGPADAGTPLYRAATEAADLERAGEALLEFEALGPYLRAIGDKHGLDPLSLEVVEAYWIGNRLLDAFDRTDFRAILEALGRRGLPASSVARLAARLPERPVPHHAFHVSFVGVGAVTGHAPTTLRTMESCRPSWGSVQSVAEATMEVEAPTLERRGGGFHWGAAARSTRPWDRRLLPGLRPGSDVAIHWSTPVLELDGEQRRALEHWSRLAFERAGPALVELLGPG